MSFSYFLILSLILFGLGVLGFTIRRNIFILLMAIELMLNSSNLLLVSASKYLKSIDGQIIVFFVMIVAAAEVAVGLSLIVALIRLKNTVNVDDINLMKW